VTETRRTVLGNDLVRHAMVVLDVTPAEADGLVAKVSNARILSASSGGVRCPPRWTSEGEAELECPVREGHAETFRLTLHVTFAEATLRVSGSVELMGGGSHAVHDFTVTPS
jgi:hypothetical protein